MNSEQRKETNAEVNLSNKVLNEAVDDQEISDSQPCKMINQKQKQQGNGEELNTHNSRELKSTQENDKINDKHDSAEHDIS